MSQVIIKNDPAPADPPSGYTTLYAKDTDGLLYFNYSGTEYPVGSPAEPLNRIVYGTGTGLDSSSTLTYDSTNGAFTLDPGTVTTPANILIRGATKATGAPVGNVNIYGAPANNTSGGQVNIYGGSTTGTAAAGGSITINGGDPTVDGAGGSVTVTGGDATGGTFNGGNFSVAAGSASGTGSGGDVDLYAGASAGGNGGNVLLRTGVNGGTGSNIEFTTTNTLRMRLMSTGALEVGGSEGTSGQALTSNGAGTPPTWQTAGSGSPGGADTNIQFNNTGSFGGDADFVFNTTTKEFTLAGGVVAGPGNITLAAFDESGTGTGGNVFISAGAGGATAGDGGNFDIVAGSAATEGNGGGVTIEAGSAASAVSTTNGGNVDITAGDSYYSDTMSTGGGVTLTAGTDGNGPGNNSNGGSITFSSGGSFGSGAGGNIVLTAGSGSIGNEGTGGSITITTGSGGVNATGDINNPAGTLTVTTGSTQSITATDTSASSNGGGDFTFNGGSGGSATVTDTGTGGTATGGSGATINLFAGIPGDATIAGSTGSGTSDATGGNGGQVSIYAAEGADAYTNDDNATAGAVITGGNGGNIAISAGGSGIAVNNGSGTPTLIDGDAGDVNIVAGQPQATSLNMPVITLELAPLVRRSSGALNWNASAPVSHRVLEYIIGGNTTSTGTFEKIYIDGTYETRLLLIPNNKAWQFTADIVANSTAGAAAMYRIEGGIKNNTNTVSFVGTPVVTTLGEDDAAWDVQAVANDTDDSLDIEVKGNGQNINWVAVVRIVETGKGGGS